VLWALPASTRVGRPRHPGTLSREALASPYPIVGRLPLDVELGELYSDERLWVQYPHPAGDAAVSRVVRELVLPKFELGVFNGLINVIEIGAPYLKNNLGMTCFARTMSWRLKVPLQRAGRR
jgi:hypothetical protein